MRYYQVMTITNIRGDLDIINHIPVPITQINVILEHISSAYDDITHYRDNNDIIVPLDEISTNWLANLTLGNTYLSDYTTDIFVYIFVFDID